MQTAATDMIVGEYVRFKDIVRGILLWHEQSC